MPSTGTAVEVFIDAAERRNVYPDGFGDSTVGLQDAINIASSLGGGIVYLRPGIYKISGELTLPSYVELRGATGGKHLLVTTVLRLTAGFIGPAAIGFPSGSAEQHITNLSIDGSLPTAGTVIGIAAASGEAQYVQLTDLLISGAGISNGISTGGNSSNGWRCRNVVVLNVGSSGIVQSGSGDHNWTDCQVIGSGSYGWSLSGIGNSKFTACRGDFSTNAGWFIQGSWTTGSGSGGIQLLNCSTDRNGQDGVFISGTGNSPILISGLMCRRDGSSSTSSGYAGLRLGSAATLPVIVNGMTCYSGVNDDGTGNDGPQYGINYQASAGYLAVTNAYLHAVSAGTNGSISNYRAITTRTGSTSSPGSITQVSDSA